MRLAAGLLIAAASAGLLGSAALAQAREALIIANQDYAAAVGPLANTHEDADLIAGALRSVGFNVREVKEADRLTVLHEIRDHAARVAAGGQGAIGLFYYTGHGAADETSGRNYLIPVDVTSTSDATLWDASVQVDEIQRLLSLAAPAANHFILFDACRNELRLPYRDASRGFVPQANMGGMFVSFSTAPGARASDGDPADPGGPYAMAFAEEIAKEAFAGGSRDATNFFQDLRFNVRDRTNRAQLPWQVNGLADRVYPFASAGARVTSREDGETSSPPAFAIDPADSAAWASVSDDCDAPAYLEEFPDGVYAAAARIRADACAETLRQSDYYRVMTPELVNARKQYLEQFSGPAFSETHANEADISEYRFDGCRIKVWSVDDLIVAYAAEYSDECPLDLERTFSVHAPEFQARPTLRTAPLYDFASGCFGSCGNRTPDFLIMLEGASMATNLLESAAMFGGTTSEMVRNFRDRYPQEPFPAFEGRTVFDVPDLLDIYGDLKLEEVFVGRDNADYWATHRYNRGQEAAQPD